MGLLNPADDGRGLEEGWMDPASKQLVSLLVLTTSIQLLQS